MTAFDPGFVPPPPIATERFRLEPLGPEHTERDYEAIMGCRVRLRAELQWKGWPPDTFTVEDNRKDLAEHRAEYDRREAFAYSVLHPSGAPCLGCVYLETHGDGARLAFWVIDDALALEGPLVARVLAWIDEAWPIERVVLPLRNENARGAAVLGSLGLRKLPDVVIEDHETYG